MVSYCIDFNFFHLQINAGNEYFNISLCLLFKNKQIQYIPEKENISKYECLYVLQIICQKDETQP